MNISYNQRYMFITFIVTFPILHHINKSHMHLFRTFYNTILSIYKTNSLEIKIKSKLSSERN